MTSAVVSLSALVLTIVVANLRKLNVGFAALAAAMILGLVYGLNLDTILEGFNIKLVVRMFSMQLLVVIARQNGTLQYVAQKLQSICRGRAARIFPFLLYGLMLAAELLGFNLHSMLIPVLAAIAFSLRVDVLQVVLIGEFTMFAGCFSPYTTPGIMLYGYLSEAGLAISPWNIPVLCILSYSALFLLFYFRCGWHRARIEAEPSEEPIVLDRARLCTILAYLMIAAANLTFGIDIGITSCLCALLLCLLKFAKPEQAVLGIPYSILIMIGGISCLLGVVTQLGGMELLSRVLTVLPSETLTPAVLTVLAGALSIFSSASSVVQPMLIAAIPQILHVMPGLSAQTLVSSIAVGSYAVAMSPFDANGAQIMAAYAAVYTPTDQQRRHVFNQLLKLAVWILLYQSLLAILGFYRIQLF